MTQIDAMTWEGEAAVDPVGPRWPVAEWLDLARRWGLTLRVLPVSLIGGAGPYAGGQVLLAEGWADRLYFAVPVAAIPALVGRLPDEDYAALLRDTPALGARSRRGVTW